ncbi:MAG: hypothetical protein HQ566_04145 [Candidatus Omnitrophica bacterium]|nr:hypothetical protein [Candidatus Omnitrophota bacterium]
MDKTLRSILWILVGLVVLSSFSTGWFFMAKENLYDEYVSLETLFKTSMERLNREIASSNKNRMELKSKLEAVEKELSVLESRNIKLEFQHEKLLSEKDDLKEEVARVKKGKFFLEKKVKDMESDNFMAGLLREKVVLEVELKRLKDERAPKDAEIERLKNDIMDLDIKLSQSEQEKDLLAQKISDSTTVAEILSKDLLKEKDRNKEDRREAENIKIENRILKTRLADLEKDTEDKGREINKMKVALDRTRDAREFRAEAYHAPAEVELPPIVLQRDDYGASTGTSSAIEWTQKRSSLEGRIVTVNREHDFVVIDLGEQDGIDIGTRFDVYRGDLFIGSLEAIQARKGISACDIKDVKQGFYIEIDDLVIKR